MGLLDKALTIEPEGEEHDSNAPFFSPDIPKLINSLTEAGNGLDFSTILFSRIVEELKISKGALLLSDENKRFVPWAVEGFDQTTSRRIRIPDELISSLRNEDQYTYVELKDSEVDLLKDFFSFREYSVTRKVLIAPIKTEDQIVALLFISKGEILLQGNSDKREWLSQLSKSAGPLLISKRENILSKLQKFSSGGDDIKGILNRKIETDHEKPFLLLSVNVEELITLLHSRDKGAIDFQLMKDILRLIKTLIGDRGEVAAKDTRSFYVYLDSSRKEEAELFIHQIGLSLGYFFKVDSSSFSLTWNLASYPEEGETSDKLLNHF